MNGQQVSALLKEFDAKDEDDLLRKLTADTNTDVCCDVCFKSVKLDDCKLIGNRWLVCKSHFQKIIDKAKVVYASKA